MKTSPSKSQKEGTCYRGSHAWSHVYKKRGTEKNLKGKDRMKRFYQERSGSLVLSFQPWSRSSGQNKEREQGNEETMNYAERKKRRIMSILEREDTREISRVIFSVAIGRHYWQRGDRDKKGCLSSDSFLCYDANGSREETCYEEKNRRERENRTLFPSTCFRVKMTSTSAARSSHTLRSSITSPLGVHTPDRNRTFSHGEQQVYRDCTHKERSFTDSDEEIKRKRMRARSESLDAADQEKENRQKMDVRLRTEKGKQRAQPRKTSPCSIGKLVSFFLLIFSLSFSNLSSLFFTFLSLNFLASPYRHLSHSPIFHDPFHPSATLRISLSVFRRLSFPSFPSAALLPSAFSPASFISSFSIPPLLSGEIPVSLFSTQTFPKIVLASAFLPDETSSLSFSSSLPVDFSSPSFGIDTPSEDPRLSALSLLSHVEGEVSRLSEKERSIPQSLSFKTHIAGSRARALAPEEIDGEDYDADVQGHKEARVHDERKETRRLSSEKETPQIRRIERKRLQREEKKTELNTMQEKSQESSSSLLRGRMKKGPIDDTQAPLHGDKPAIFNPENQSTKNDLKDISHTVQGSASSSLLPSSSLPSSSSSSLFPPPRLLSSSSTFPTPPEKDALPETSPHQDTNPTPSTSSPSVISSSSSRPSPHPVSPSSPFTADHSASSPPRYPISRTQKEKPAVKKRRLVQFKKKADTVVLTKSLPSSTGHTARNLDTMHEKTGGNASHTGDIQNHEKDDNAENVIERPLKGSSSSSLSLGGGVGGGIYHREHTGATRPWIW